MNSQTQSTPPQGQSPVQQYMATLDFTEPPDVQIIEASCALANTRTQQNNKWTNTLKEPLLVKKGSQIRCASSFINMSGMDQEIIQFQPTGDTQDNSHTLLTQLYTANDGTNGKTTSYDYISHNIQINALEPTELGDTCRVVTCSCASLSGAGNGLIISILQVSNNYQVLRDGISIPDAGIGYKSGDKFTISSALHTVGGDNAFGFVIVNDSGSIVDFTLQHRGTYNNGSPPDFVITISTASGGSGGTMHCNTPIGGQGANSAMSFSVHTEGQDYQVGEVVELTPNDGGAAFTVKPRIKINVVGNTGNVLNKLYYDQGYNYARVPVFRWAQTFDFNSTYVYGRNIGERSFTASNGKEISVFNPPPLFDYDMNLSNGFNLGNKEDEFCSGVYHRNGQTQAFTVAKPTISIAQDTLGIDFLMRTISGISEVIIPNIQEEYTDSYGQRITVFQNPLNQFALGQCFVISFGLKNNGIIGNETTWNDLQAVAQNYQGVYSVGQKTLSDPGDQITIGGQLYTGYQVLRIGPVNSFNGGQIAVQVGSNPPIYDQPQTGFPYLYQLAGVDNLVGTPNATYTVPMTNKRREDGQPMTGAGATINVTINGAGNGWQSFSSNNNGTNYHQGDILEFANPDGSANTIEVYVLSIDGISGQTFFAAQGASISKADLLCNGQPCQMNIVAQPFYTTGVGNINVRPASNAFNFNPNSIGVMKNLDRTAGSHFTNYPQFPPTFDTLGLRDGASIPANRGLQKTTVKSGLCKPNGYRFGFTDYNNLRANFSAHSDSEFEVVTPNPPALTDYNNIVTRTFVAGTDAATSAFYIGATDPMPANEFTFKILKVSWAADPTTYPSNYLILKFADPVTLAPKEDHCYIRSVTVDATHLIFNLRARNIQQMQVPLLTTNVANIGEEMYRGVLPTENRIGAGSNVELVYVPDWVAFNSRIHLRWSANASDINSGTIGFTNNKNFYGISDPNIVALKTTKDFEPLYSSALLDPLIMTSYQSGGYYFLTQAWGMLGVPNGNPEDQYGYMNMFGFSQGFNEFPLGDVCTGQSANNPYFFSTPESISDVSSVYEYEKYMKQKTFKMDQNFETPSSIGATWTKIASELSGAIDQATGNVMAPAEQVGLLQNEFCTPVYGSNNEIGNDGKYIKNERIYPLSGGLEPGHCVGISGYDSSASYLATEIMNELPFDVDTNSIYFVFFRTFFTLLRNYDPLKGQGATPGLPDRTPLKTLATAASNIGNVNSSTTTPPVTTQKTLDGTTMIDISLAGPPPRKDFKLYELGSPNPATTNVEIPFPSSSLEYPIRYIEQDGTGNLDRAKVSNYVGANNLTLAFQQDISSFGFTFFHQPYVTPFADGQGGEVSTRIFFGNRKLGIFNHDAFGGVSIVNYCRPDFPNNIFTYEEIILNSSNGSYTNGIDPLTSVAPIGRRFMQKLGFSDSDMGIIENANKQFVIDNTLNRLGIQTTSNTREITLDDGTTTQFASYDLEVYGTTFTKINSSDSILTSIPPPESSPGLASHVVIVTPTNGKSNRIIQQFGDYIFYPYSYDSATDSFSEASKVRYDNASSAFGTIGGLNLTSGTANRGMGTPNVLGSTTVVSQNTVPVSLNPDCNIYLSYTIQADSNFISATNLPVKLNHGHMIILSSLIQSPNYHLNNQGRLPGISIVNKTFLQGDYILSMGQLTFYAVRDHVVSEIVTEIVNNDYTVPSSLGLQSTVIYEITNYNPKPAKPPGTIFAKQQIGYLLNQQMQEMQGGQNGGPPSRMQNLLGDLDRLGLGVLEDPTNNNSSVINQLAQYVRGFDLLNLTPADRQAFYATDAGQAFVNHAQAVMSMQRNMGLLEAQFEEQAAALGAGNDPRQTTYQQVLTELAGLPGLPPIADAPIAEQIVAPPDPLGDFLDGGGEVPDELRGLAIANPLQMMSLQSFQSDYGGDLNQYFTHLLSTDPDMRVPPPIPAPAVPIQVASGGGGAESGVGTSVAGSSTAGAPTVDTGIEE